ncbi:MAG: efflux RND transporter periplasmic adaptor subunit [Amylibacter sp.]|nr:efflux RND transporter periplasmic adaptor subunit [Amylibacter sp.]
MHKLFLIVLLAFSLTACKEDSPDTADTNASVRGLKTVLIEDVEYATVRRFPSVLQPASVSALSFEVAGKLKEITLDVGQRVMKGDVIAELDPRVLELNVENARAGLASSLATAKNAADNLDRQIKLLASGTVTKVMVDDARTQAETSAAQVTQAEKTLAKAEEDLSKTVLRAPYDGIVNSLEAESFATVGVASLIATIYATDAFEVSFSVNYEVVNMLTVGKRAQVRLADNPRVVLDAVVSELGSRADTVSSFPVVVTLTQSDAQIKAGMAVEVTLEFAVANGQGFRLPLSAAIKKGQIERKDQLDDPSPMGVYVYDPDTGTVKVRKVMVAGVRENSLLIVDGLSAGERVASAGVSFLRDGQKVKLLADSE